MKQRPIPFKGEMVRAIIKDIKTQTRRLGGLDAINKQPNEWEFHRVQGGYPDGRPRFVFYSPGSDDPIGLVCPKGAPGDRLWVKETSIIAPKRFADPDDTCVKDADGDPRFIQYLASHPDTEAAEEWYNLKKTPSIFMPRWASRITLEITGVRVERLNEISEADAIAEGIKTFTKDDVVMKYWACDPVESRTPKALRMTWQDMPRTSTEAYRALWESINGPGSWEANQWVWVIEFKNITTK